MTSKSRTLETGVQPRSRISERQVQRGKLERRDTEVKKQNSLMPGSAIVSFQGISWPRCCDERAVITNAMSDVGSAQRRRIFLSDSLHNRKQGDANAVVPERGTGRLTKSVLKIVVLRRTGKHCALAMAAPLSLPCVIRMRLQKQHRSIV